MAKNKKKSEYEKELRKTSVSITKNGVFEDYIEDEYLDEEGNAVIDIKLDDDYEIFNPLSMGNQKEINPDIFDYIDQKADLIPMRYPLVIRFHSKPLAEEDKSQISHCIKEHYFSEIQDVDWDKKKNNWLILLMSLIGVLFIVIYLICELTNSNMIIIEIMSIIGWFAIWEAANHFFVDRNELKRKKLEVTQSYIAKIEFIEE